jgi:hypothetical protein
VRAVPIDRTDRPAIHRALGWELNRFSSEEIGGELHSTLFFGPNDEAVVDLTVPKKPPP